MHGRVFWYRLELNTQLQEVKLAFPEVDDIFSNSSFVEVTSKSFKDSDEAMKMLNEDANSRFQRLQHVNQENKYELLKVGNPFKVGVPDNEITDDDREFWSTDKLTIILGVRENEDEFMFRYTFHVAHESERAFEINRDMKALPWDSQFALLHNFPTTLQ
jgi:hypothetical protein